MVVIFLSSGLADAQYLNVKRAAARSACGIVSTRALYSCSFKVERSRIFKPASQIKVCIILAGVLLFTWISAEFLCFLKDCTGGCGRKFHYRKVFFVGPKDSTLTLFLFVALLSVLSTSIFFLHLKTCYKKKEAGFKSTFGVPVCFQILQSAVMRSKTTKKGDFFFFCLRGR